MTTFRLFLFFLASFPSLYTCRASLPSYLEKSQLKSELNYDHLPIVFVPGIKGSLLRNKDGNVQWLSASQALSFSNPDLRLHGDSKDLIPSGAIGRITAIPYLIDIALYGPWLSKMTEQKEIDFYVFSYDWRKDNLNTRDQLITFLEEIGKKYKKKPLLIGHSMGGMLSFSTINKNPSLAGKIVLVGVPFRGGIGYMKDLYLGVPTGFNSKIQSPCVIAKYESVYGFFPRLGTQDSNDVVVNEDGKFLGIDFFKESSWKENNLGFYAQNCKEEEIPSPLEFQNILNRAKLFRDSLDPTSTLLKNQPPMLVVNGESRPTRKAITLIKSNLGSGPEKKWNIEVAPRAAGDGSVLLEHSLPPGNFRYQTIQSDYEHSLLLNDRKIQDRILVFLK